VFTCHREHQLRNITLYCGLKTRCSASSEIINKNIIELIVFSDSDGCCERFRGTRARSALPSITILFEGVGAFFPVPHEISLGRSHHFFASLFPKTSGTSEVSRGGILESVLGRDWRRPSVAIEFDAIDEFLDEVFTRTLARGALCRAVRVDFGTDATARSLRMRVRSRQDVVVRSSPVSRLCLTYFRERTVTWRASCGGI